MSVEREIVLTPEGYRRLKDEIDYLSTKKRDEVAERIRDSRQYGDITENSEYDDAKNEQAMLEQRIAVLEEKLRSAKIIESGDVKTESVGLGTRVTLQDMQRGDMLQYHIVGSAEADPTDHKLSNESPVGRAIMGRRPGDVVSVVVPKGTTKLKVITIERA
jgi:transcription elongation factor GreA